MHKSFTFYCLQWHFGFGAEKPLNAATFASFSVWQLLSCLVRSRLFVHDKYDFAEISSTQMVNAKLAKPLFELLAQGPAFVRVRDMNPRVSSTGLSHDEIAT
ncbi:hypothetical protein Spb1_12020 [Planctopirus ephydatiae]|uniref:Uncharacterized protein n=1 Tax=Planctopirus ephydatiae TaxID=2528019 RepID=A0A518GKY6_9PLAN|nr:hypothetical protein Spb1_12020 [Planctopirus ephydatiae]